MECKAKRVSPITANASVLIETLWNVKFFIQRDDSKNSKVLIETLWNVKSGEGLGNSERAECFFQEFVETEEGSRVCASELDFA